MKVGDYVRTKEGYLCKILEIHVEYDDEYLDWNDIGSASIRKSHIVKSSPNIIDLIEVGDVIRYEIETPLETSGILKGVADVTDEEMLQNLKKDKAFHVKSIVTREQFSQMEYKVGE